MGLIALAVVAYISTNIDDLLLLCGFFAHPAYANGKIIFGQFLGIGILVAISLLCALATIIIPVCYVGLLGFAPIYLGLSTLLRRYRGHAPLSGSGQMAAVVAATVADGGDNIATYVPIFAASSYIDSLVIVSVFAAMTGLWCWLAQILINHALAGQVFRRLSQRLLPFLLIIIGLLVFWRNGTYGLLP